MTNIVQRALRAIVASLWWGALLGTTHMGRAAIQSYDIGIDDSLTVSLSNGDIAAFTIPPASLEFDISKAFYQLKVSVEVGDKSVELPWHSVRGISDDDFHKHLQTIIYKLAGEDEFEKPSADTLHRKSFIRDILSSCPSPIVSRSRNACSLSFSPFGSTSVSARPKQDVTFTLTTSYDFNEQLPIFLAVGFLLLSLAKSLSKSKMFQYLGGAVAFIAMGVVIALVWCFGGQGRDRRPGMASTGFTALLAGTYGATAIWFLKTNFKHLLLKYWEYSLGYVIVSGLSGIVFVHFVRSFEGTKLFMRWSIGWVIRLIGASLMYNSLSSPLLSMSLMGGLIVLGVLSAITESFLGVFGGGKRDKRRRSSYDDGGYASTGTR